ncbi:HD domain-containing protein [Ralstonia solanacearum]|uniref:AAA family ATPase n=1 Tax=Ralstonia solanacearum TaxID=305 RepID=UPI0005ACB6BF|nr:AAA family ATPase [Ralstonia solanacearum]MDC6179072.1 AAA family ATPase [Ralstonia solanacearum]MDC6211137.1 AAA family ATPase [Ralstonia solanacearum]MDC6240503.1 AAA family ATPase [Ralstonia solanacearum]MDD7802305.1 AAA family ATPase [Ralstonia solanacearum]TYZ50971.1 HD domain-containing protein [Ralstonia solanacearum]
MHYEQLRALVPAPGKSPDFQACLAAFPALAFAKTTPQDPRYHGEGDVWTHTQMVVEALLALPDYQAAPRAEQEVVFLAALLHDVAKYSTTVVDPMTGAIGQPGHSRKGAIDARIALWDAGVPFDVRESVCRLISVHQVPFFALDGSRRGTPEFLVRELSWQLSIPSLAMLAESDMRGRICADKARVLDNIELFRELARDEGCYGTPRRFADAHTAVSYFRGADVHPDYPLHQAPGSRVIVMSGLPASGKNTWVDAHHPELPVVSFDDARDALGLRHGKNEGMVAHLAVDRAKALLRAQQPFIWNATHLSERMRQKTLDLLFAYHAEVEIAYLEQPRAELLRRNTKRDTSLSNKALASMLHRWSVPLPTEAHHVRYVV